jgi:multidrug efflux pump subunit AcrB
VKNDPLLMASFISSMWRERNPFLLMVQDFKRQVDILVRLKDNMRASQQRIQQLELQTSRIESLMEESRPQRTGNRLNTWK